MRLAGYQAVSNGTKNIRRYWNPWRFHLSSPATRRACLQSLFVWSKLIGRDAVHGRSEWICLCLVHEVVLDPMNRSDRRLLALCVTSTHVDLRGYWKALSTR